MKKILIGLLALGSFSVFGNDITNRIPTGQYKGSNDQGTCWVYVSLGSFGTANVTVSKVGPTVRPSPGQSLNFSETKVYETARNSAPDILTITNLIIPNDSYTRKQEARLAIKNLGTKNMVKISSKEKFMGFWINEQELNCSIKY